MKKNSSRAESIKPNDIITRLLFEWPIQTAPRLALPLFILLAALLHLSTVYFFNIVYELPHVSKSSSVQVFFLLPNSQASQQLAPWLEANDSAVFSPLKTVQISHPKVPAAIYQLKQPPPNLHSLPPCKEEKMRSLLPPTDELVLPPTLEFFGNSAAPANKNVTPTLGLPSGLLTSVDSKGCYQPAVFPEGAPKASCASLESAGFAKNLLEQSPMRTATSSAAINTTTTVCLLGNMAARVSMPASGLGHPCLPLGMRGPLHPTMLTVNMDAAGAPHHVIIAQSSGNLDADESAVHWLMTRHFNPSEEEIWGSVLIFWGHDESLSEKDSIQNKQS